MEHLQEELAEIRQYLHRHPEVSDNEHHTHEYLHKLLSVLDTDGLQTVAGTGLLVTFRGKEQGTNILFRGDIDALPIQELNDMPYRSVHDGVSHKCGHDGHATIMYALCKHYSAQRPQHGNVYIVFQPAEEVGHGAKAIEDSGVLKELPIDLVFALHNIPGYPLKDIICREGSFTPSVTTLVAQFDGHTAHAAEPWNGKNPASAMSLYLLAALKYNMENKEQHSFVTITPVCIDLGDVHAYGTSAGHGSVHLTVRADSNERLNETLSELIKAANNICEIDGLTLSTEQRETFESNQNAKQAVNIIKQSAAQLGLTYHDKEEPFRWGEDFGLYTNRIPGAMFGIGSGIDCKPLHHPEYDYPDAITTKAAEMFLNIQQQAQQQ